MVKRRAGATLQQKQERKPMDWKKVLKQGAALLSVLLIIVGAVYVNQPETLPVMHVTVDGEIRHTDRDSLIKAVSPYVTGSFINVDVASIRDAGESLPWVKQIQVRRVWPDTLHLIVKEHTAIARWNETGLVSSTGEVFHPQTSTLSSELVHLNGPEGTSEMMARRLVDIQRQLDELGLTIVTVSMDERRAWEFEFSNGLYLRLGRAKGDERLARFIDVYRSGLKRFETQIAEIDMRYTNGLAVVWKDGQRPNFNGTV